MSDKKSIQKKKLKIESIRREYGREKLSEENLKADPFDQFSLWLEQALKAEIADANAMSLATADNEGRPSSRIVLLKGFSREGFRFFTNYNSRKAKELDENSHAALCFFWPVLERQVRIEGTAVKISRKESVMYFRQRPRNSKLGAWASEQSTTVESRDELEASFKKAEKKFAGKEIPTPDFWGGYLLQPSCIEFWQGREGRLHDRIRFKKDGESWEFQRLAP